MEQESTDGPFKKFYKINSYGRNKKGQWNLSIDSVSADGEYRSQEAFWFHSTKEARTRCAEMIEEDKARGYTSVLFES